MLIVVGSIGGRVRADEADVLTSPNGLSGGRYVGSAIPGPNAVRAVGSLGYGFTESVLDGGNDRHHRIALELAAAWVARPWFQIALAGEVRFDKHAPDLEGKDQGWLGTSSIATRHAFQVGKTTALALAPRVLLPSATKPRATSVEIAALASQRLPHDLALSLSLGYRIDRSRFAVQGEGELVPQQRLAAGFSDHNAYLLGLLLAAPFAPYQLGVEWSWDIAAGGSPKAWQSPMRLRAALQRQVGERWLPGLELGVDTSVRPELVGYTRIEPRVWARVNVAVRLDKAVRTQVRVPRYVAPAQEAGKAVPAAPQTQRLELTDEAGEPIAGASVSAGDREYTSDQRGQVQLPADLEQVTIEAPGYEPHVQSLTPGFAGTQRVSLGAPRPGSEIKGVVRNLASQPLVARIELLPVGAKVTSDREGQFVIRVAPGDYTLRISAEGYESQERPAQVEPSGVTIIVVDMKRARK